MKSVSENTEPDHFWSGECQCTNKPKQTLLSLKAKKEGNKAIFYTSDVPPLVVEPESQLEVSIFMESAYGSKNTCLLVAQGGIPKFSLATLQPVLPHKPDATSSSFPASSAPFLSPSSTLSSPRANISSEDDSSIHFYSASYDNADFTFLKLPAPSRPAPNPYLTPDEAELVAKLSDLSISASSIAASSPSLNRAAASKSSEDLSQTQKKPKTKFRWFSSHTSAPPIPDDDKLSLSPPKPQYIWVLYFISISVPLSSLPRGVTL